MAQSLDIFVFRREEFMKRILHLSIFIVIIGWLVNCSKQEFSGIPQPNTSCQNFVASHSGGTCNSTPACQQNSYSPECLNVFVDKPAACKADILFVVDNSGSMYTEQSQLASKLPDFINSISTLDYHIAVTTTDISTSPSNPPDAQNGNGTLWNGLFIKFPNGNKFLKKADSDQQHQFEQTVMRPETQSCDGGGPCPSGDERGIFAATLAVEKSDERGNRGDSNFFRDGAHLAVVILSDENERSNGGNFAGYGLEQRDLPETLIKTVRSKFGSSKLLSVHPIVVQSALTSGTGKNDVACNTTQQNQQSGVKFERYGTLYEELAKPNAGLKSLGGIVDGFAGSVCAPNYTDILKNMGQVITRNTGTFQLECKPQDLVITIDNVTLSSADYTIDTLNRVTLNNTPNCSQQVVVNYKCPRN